MPAQIRKFALSLMVLLLARMKQSAVTLMMLLLAPSSAFATWSVIAVDAKTGQVIIASATCVRQAAFPQRTPVPARDLMDLQAVIVPGVGVAACQAGADNTRQNQMLVYNELRKGTAPLQILELLKKDPDIERRQFGILAIPNGGTITAQNNIAGFNGSGNSYVSLFFGGQVGDVFYQVQGNTLLGNDVVQKAALAFTRATGTMADRVMAAMEAADENGGDKRCNCGNNPLQFVPCDNKTAHVSYIAIANKDDVLGMTHSDGKYFAFIRVTDDDIVKGESANPVKTLRMRYNNWKKIGQRSDDSARANVIQAVMIATRDALILTLTWLRSGFARRMLLTVGAAGIAAVAATSSAQTVPAKSSDYLYLWTASTDSTKPDFLAVVDVRADGPRYGRIVGTVPVPGLGNVPHHSEHMMPADGRLFVNGFGSGQSFIFDMHDPLHPKLDGQFGSIAGLMHPHTYVRLPNGNVLATFQMQHDAKGMAPGGIAELTNRGVLVRLVSANVPGVDRRIRPYSAAIVSSLDRIVTTTTDMDGEFPVRAVQVWRLSDFKLLSTFNLPNGARGNEGAFTAEPRLLDDGKTVLVSTFSCGLYLLKDLANAKPSAQLVASFPEKKGANCAIPVIAGHYYMVTVPAYSAVVILDISNPEKPREVSRMALNAGDVPHWMSIEPNHQRIVVTGYADMKSRVVIGNFNQVTGALSVDTHFRDEGAKEPGLRMDNKQWPHGGSAPGVPHGAVFSAVPN